MKNLFLSLMALCIPLRSYAIWNGKLALEGQFPATIYLENCGGVRVGPRSFLTAAHCVVGDDDLGENQKRYIQEEYRKGSQLSIHHGLNLKDDRGSDITYDVTVKETIVAPSYLKATKKNQHALDLAIIITEETRFSEIEIAEIASEQIKNGMAVVLNGYGLTDLTATQKRRLFDNSILDGGLIAVNSESNLLPQQYAYVEEIGYAHGMFTLRADTPYILRTRSSTPVVWSGDSGGPMWVRDSNEGPYLKLIGINSAANTISYTSSITALKNNNEFQTLSWLKENIK